MVDTRGAHSRLMLALAASLLLHAWAMHDSRGLGRPRVEEGGAMAMSAQLYAPPVNLLVGGEVLSLPEQTRAAAPSQVTAATVTAQQRSTPAATKSFAIAATPATQGDAPLPQPADPTYYGALSLDVYPRAITALDLGAHLSIAANGEVRSTVLIDETGAVNDVRNIDAADPEIARAARTLLLQTRFTPARRDGRIVKAEVRVSLRYGKSQ